MHWLGTCTAQRFNQRHERTGHLYQGRFGSRLIQDDGYLLELARYVPLNPVRAELCRGPEHWPWSSYAATAGLSPAPWFLDAGPLLDMLGSPSAYKSWVSEGVLGTTLDEFGVPRLPVQPSLAELLFKPTDAAIAVAHFRHGYHKAVIARTSGSAAGRSRVRSFERAGARTVHPGSDPYIWGQTPTVCARPPMYGREISASLEVRALASGS